MFDNSLSRGCGRKHQLHFLTQKERDAETGLDYFGARYYSSAQGRFTGADSLLGSLTNPQTLNRYAYVGNDPLNFTDPTGHARFDLPSKDDSGGYLIENPYYEAIAWRGVERTVAAADAAAANAFDPAAPQNSGRILIIVGDQGTRGPSGINHSVGRNLQRVAETKQRELEAQGYTVIVQRASSFDDFNNALTNNGILDGVEYIGHSSNIKIFVGQQGYPDSNIDHSNIPRLSNANLSANAYIKLNGCNVGKGGDNSIGQWLSNRLGRTVIGFDGPSRFYGSPNAIRGSGGRYPPETGPLYLLEDRGTNIVYFTPH